MTGARISDMTQLASLPASGANVPVVQDGDANNYQYDLGAGLAERPFVAATRTILDDLDHTLGSPAFLTEARHEGMFIFYTAARYLAEFGKVLTDMVTADVNQGIYVALASAPSGASGAWVRQTYGAMNPEWWGIVRGSNSGLNGTANSLAFQRMLSCLKSRTSILGGGFYVSLEKIRFPSVDTYEFAGDDDMTDCSVEIEGSGPAYSSFGTELKFPAGKSGFRFQYFNTSGLSGSRSPDGQVSSFSALRNIRMTGAFTTTEGEFHGVVIKSHGIILENVWIKLFEGDGVYSSVAVPNGNSNNCQIIGGGFVLNRRGLFLDGSDTNAWNVSGCDMSNNRWAGVYDSSFLGNSYFACSFSTNGLLSVCDGVGIPATMCTSGGNRYGVILGQEVGASTNAPSGTTDDNTWWFYVRSGGVHDGIPAWFSGMTCRAGGPVITDNANAPNEFYGCYYEGDQSLGQLQAPSKANGGLLGSGIWANGNGIALMGSASPPAAIFKPAVGAKYNNLTVTLGEKSASITTVLSITDTVIAPLIWRLAFNGNDLIWTYQNSTTLSPLTIGGPLTALQVGTGVSAAAAHFLISTKFAVGDSLANARQVTNAAGAPASGNFGKAAIAFDRNVAPSGKVGNVCTTAGAAGSTAVFKPFGAVDA